MPRGGGKVEKNLEEEEKIWVPWVCVFSETVRRSSPPTSFTLSPPRGDASLENHRTDGGAGGGGQIDESIIRPPADKNGAATYQLVLFPRPLQARWRDRPGPGVPFVFFFGCFSF